LQKSAPVFSQFAEWVRAHKDDIGLVIAVLPLGLLGMIYSSYIATAAYQNDLDARNDQQPPVEVNITVNVEVPQIPDNQPGAHGAQ
jgi:hypothetical protein